MGLIIFFCMPYCVFVLIYISLLDLSFPLFAFENLLFSYDMPYILVKCTCPKLFLNGGCLVKKVGQGAAAVCL